MNARKKLNQANVNGALLLALVVGWLFQSLTASIVAVLFFMTTALYTGDIRGSASHDLSPGPPPKQRRFRNRRD